MKINIICSTTNFYKMRNKPQYDNNTYSFIEIYSWEIKYYVYIEKKKLLYTAL